MKPVRPWVRAIHWPFVILAAFVPMVFLAVAVSPAPKYVPGLRPPGHPAVRVLSPTKILIVIDANGNTVGTLYAIEEALTHRYVQIDGSLGAAPVFRTFLDWGLDAGVVVTVMPNTRYRFIITAQNLE
jgi:hypothetical protein